MSSGWQDAVANLQSQINTINSQISSLSGQEAADASAIGSLQTQVNALQAEITSLQQQVVLADLPASSIAVLSGLTASNQTVQLVGGGDAILQTDFLSDTVFRVRVAGEIFIANNPGENVSFIILINGQGLASISPSGNNTRSPLFFDILGFWDSSTQKLLFRSTSISVNFSGTGVPSTVENPESGLISLPSAANFQFKIQANAGTTDSGSVTVREFRALAN